MENRDPQQTSENNVIDLSQHLAQEQGAKEILLVDPVTASNLAYLSNPNEFQRELEQSGIKLMRTDDPKVDSIPSARLLTDQFPELLNLNKMTEQVFSNIPYAITAANDEVFEENVIEQKAPMQQEAVNQMQPVETQPVTPLEDPRQTAEVIQFSDYQSRPDIRDVYTGSRPQQLYHNFGGRSFSNLELDLMNYQSSALNGIERAVTQQGKGGYYVRYSGGARVRPAANDNIYQQPTPGNTFSYDRAA